MKLIDILVEELPKRGGWMEGVEHAWCDPDGEIRFRNGGCKPDFYPETDVDIEFRVPDASYEDDSRYIITREQYEAALAASKRCDHKWVPSEGRTQSGYLCSKCGNYDSPGYDWIDWPGGECPVPEGALVDVRYRNSEKFPDTFGTIALAVGGYGATGRHWNHDGYPNDIIAYRLHQPQEAEQAKADDEADLNECIGQDATPVWNGEGQPPVGVECEYSWAGEPWASGVIRYISKHTIIIETQADSTGDTECAYHPTDIKLRPFRTEADRKRDEAVQALCNAGGGSGRVDEKSGYGSCWFDIYDAIAAGKIPGVRLDN